VREPLFLFSDPSEAISEEDSVFIPPCFFDSRFRGNLLALFSSCFSFSLAGSFFEYRFSV